LDDGAGAPEEASMARVRIGELLVEQGRIDALQLQSALAYQRQFGGRLGHAIVALGFMDEASVLAAVGAQLGVPVLAIGDRRVAPEVLALVPPKLMRARRAVPLAKLSESRRGPLLVALPDPADLSTLDEISFATGLDVRPVLASDDDVLRALARLLDGDHRAPAATPAPRTDAIDVPEDDGPLAALRRRTPLH
jgi:type IV pilus assembly protein PilB